MSGIRTILASASPRRHELLTMVGIAHDVLPADIDERYRAGEAPREHTLRLALEKARTVATRERDALVIAADTIVIVDGDVLGKPRDAQEARTMLSRLSGREHTVITAVAVGRRGRSVADAEEVEVRFRPLDAAEIEAYIATGEPMDKAGAYGIQGFGATIVERVEGDYFAVMGLPLMRLTRLASQLGLRYAFDGFREAPA